MHSSLLNHEGAEAIQSRLLELGCHCERFGPDTIRELSRTSSELAYLVPAAALDSSQWPQLRVRLAHANRHYIVAGDRLGSADIMRAARDGAFDVVLIGDDDERWAAALEKVVQSQQLWLRVYGSSSLQAQDLLIGDSPAMRSLRQSIERLGPTGATVLLQGESGVGKELVARMLHQSSGKTAFVPVNCAAIPRELLEAELFGAEKGAYTGALKSRPGLVEQAAEGTLLLDEIGELDLPMQPKLLRFLETRRARRVGGSSEYNVDLRVISATNMELATAVTGGKFRADLYYRLSEVTLHVPPLRAHLEDIALLALAFARGAGERFGKHFESLEPELVIKLQQYDWPGNVRELKNAIDRMAIFYDGPLLRAGWWDLPKDRPASPSASAGVEQPAAPPTAPTQAPLLGNRQQRLEAAKRLLAEGNHDLTWIAAQVGINTSTLYRWRKAAKV